MKTQPFNDLSGHICTHEYDIVIMLRQQGLGRRHIEFGRSLFYDAEVVIEKLEYALPEVFAVFQTKLLAVFHVDIRKG
jgi:hypothetical protein